jgi:hypothetical protein
MGLMGNGFLSGPECFEEVRAGGDDKSLVIAKRKYHEQQEN